MLSADKKYYPFIAVLLFILLFFKPTITGGDAYGYYAILEGIGRYHTLNLSNEQQYNDIVDMEYIYWNNATQRYVSKYAPGLALQSLPLYEISLVLDNFGIFHIADQFFLRTRGDILVHQLSVTLTTLFFLAVSFYYTLKSMEYLHIRQISRVIILTFFGTPIMLYSTQYSSYTHVIESGIFSAMVYYTLQEKNKSRAYLIGALTGIITTVRYLDVLLASIYYSHLKDRKKMLAFAAGIIPFAMLLMLYFLVQYGSYFSTGYSNEKMLYYPVFLLKVLFDFDRGILFWTPLFFISIYGVLMFGKELRNKFILPFILLILFYSGWWAWDSGWSFGNRFFIVLFPLQCIGIGKALDEKPRLGWIAYLAAAYAFLLGMLFLASTSYIPEPYRLTSQISFWRGPGTIQMFLSGLYDKMFFLRFILDAQAL